MLDKYDLEKEFEVYSKLVDELIVNRNTLSVLKEGLTEVEDAVYTNVYSSVDVNGKSLFKNEESRKIEVRRLIKQNPVYDSYVKLKQKNIELELSLEKQRLLLDLLKQEKEFKIKYGVGVNENDSSNE